jgi:lantibiotic modifying enzyme
VNYAITSEDIDNFIGKIGNTEEFPFTKEDLKQFLTSCEKIEIKDQAEVTQTCKNTFEMYSTIFDGIRQYVEGDLGGETI